MLFLTTSQRCVVRVHTFLKGRAFCHCFYALYLMETQIMQETNSTKALIYVSLGYFIMDQGERFL